MRKLVNVLTLLLLTQTASLAQYFTLTPNGFVSEDNSDYIVVDFPGIRKDELYTNVLNALNTIYLNPKESLSVVEGESITINAYESKIIPSRVQVTLFSSKIFQHDLSYTLSILFKDEKIRINSPSFQCRRWYESNDYRTGFWTGWVYLHLVKTGKAKFAIYDDKGKVISKEAHDKLNAHFQDLIIHILDKSRKVNDW